MHLMAGRYESSETFDGVCSIECKHAQLDSLRNANVSGKPTWTTASTRSPMRAPRVIPVALLSPPSTYSMIGEVMHGKAILAVALERLSNGQQPKHPLLYTAGEGLLRVWQDTTTGGIPKQVGAVSVQGDAVLRACKVTNAGHLVSVADSPVVSVIQGSETPTQPVVTSELKAAAGALSPWPTWAPGMNPAMSKHEKRRVLNACVAIKAQSPLAFVGCSRGVISA